MLRFCFRRILTLIPLLLCVLIIVFTICSVMPGDPVLVMLGSDYTQEDYDLLAHQFNLDQPFFRQLWDYIVGVVTRFDLGTSFNTRQSVNAYIAGRIWPTAQIGILSCILTLILSIPVGIISATKQYSALDYTATTLSVIVASMPGFWLALMLILLFSLKLNWLPTSGLSSWKHYILPVFCNSLAPLAQITRQTRSSMLEVIRQDYVRTARSKGISERKIIFHHVLRNALIPIITVSGVQFTHVIGGSVIVESIFSIPGIGSALVTAIGNRDYPVIMGITFIIAIFVGIINMIVDIVYAAVDPRIKAKIMEGSKRKKSTKILAGNE